MRKILAVFGDTHGGSKAALMAPGTILFDEDEEGNPVAYQPKLTKAQEYLWEIYQEGIEGVCKLAGRDEIVLIHNGDATQGNKYPAALVSTRISDQPIIAERTIAEFLKRKQVKKLRLCVGTAAHNFSEGAAEMIVTQYLQRTFPDKDVKILYHGNPTIAGLSVDFAHHGPHPGSRSWLKGNVARFYLRDFMINEMSNGRRPADLLLRAHRHEYIYEYLKQGQYESRLVITPSYSMLGDYAVQATQSTHILKHGMVAFEIVDGKLSEPYEFMKTIDIRTKENL